VAVVSLPARGRPPQAAARRAGLEFVEKLLTTKLTSTSTTERNAGMLRVRSSHRWSNWLLVLVLVVLVAVAHRGRLAIG
jgi:hypothetical protein